MIRDRGSLLAGGLVLVTLLLGIVSGIAIDRWLLRDERPRTVAPFRATEAQARFDPARFRTRFTGQLSRELNLTADQRVRVESLLVRRQAEARSVMREMSPRLAEVSAKTEAELRKVLTDEQWRKFRERTLERRRR